MIGAVARKLFGSSNDRRIRAFRPRVDEITALEKELEQLSDEALRARTDEFKKQLAEGASLDDIRCPPSPRCARPRKRTLGQRHFDVQLIGGMVLHEGTIAEMKTGEGKTLVATLPVYLNALAGAASTSSPSTIISPSATPNGWGRSTVSRPDRRRHRARHRRRAAQAAYDCDVTYGTNNEFGFDYLRDNMKYRLEDMVQRGHTYAIVDEVELDPDRRGAHAAHHLRPARRPLRFLQHDRRLCSQARRGRFRARRKAAHRHADRSRHGKDGAGAAAGGPAQNRFHSTTSRTSPSCIM